MVRLASVACICVMMLFAVNDIAAETSFAGLDSVQVVVDVGGVYEEGQLELLRAKYRTDAELQLRTIGVPISDKAMNLFSLTLTMILGCRDEQISYMISAELIRPGTINGVVIPVTVWSDGMIGVAGVERARTVIPEDLWTYLRRFVNEFLKANPNVTPAGQ